MRMRARRMGLFGAAIGIAVALGSCGGAADPAGAPAPADAHDAAWPQPVTAFVGVRVFDGEIVLPAATVLVAGEEIVAVGREVAVPAGAIVVDGAGRTLLPGLIDAHTHVWDGAQLETSLTFGVTTVLDMMTPAEAAARFRSEQAGPAGFTRADIHAHQIENSSPALSRNPSVSTIGAEITNPSAMDSTIARRAISSTRP